MTAQCDPGWDWASNSLGQNPCAIAGSLEAPCRGLAIYNLGPLNHTNYVPPPKGNALPCECNTIMYSLFMACTVCQSEPLQSWNLWAQNCDAVYVSQYPLSIPSDTAVPHWAYLNVTTTGSWDQTASMAALGQPGSTGTKPPVSTLPSGFSGTKTGSLPTSTSKGSSNTGAIVGGVVGGLAGLGMLAALAVWFIVRRRRSKVAPSSAFMNRYQTPTSLNYPKYEPPPASVAAYNPPHMAYNPSDPSTFPPGFPEPSAGGVSDYPQTTYEPLSPRRGQYSGAAEI